MVGFNLFTVGFLDLEDKTKTKAKIFGILVLK
jgi:hypothetical protein